MITIMIVDPDRVHTLELPIPRIFRKYITRRMKHSSKKNPKELKGESIEMIILDDNLSN